MDDIMNRKMTKALSANRLSSSIHAEGDQRSPLHKKEGAFVFTPLHRGDAKRSSWKRTSIIEDEEDVFVAGLTFHSSDPPFGLMQPIEQREEDHDIPSSKSFSNPAHSPNHSPALIRCSSIPDDIQHHQLVFQFGEKYRRQSIATELHAVSSRRPDPTTRGLPTSTKSVPNFKTIVELEVGRDLRIISDMFNIESAGTVAGYKFAGYQFASRRRSDVKRIFSLPDPLSTSANLTKSKSLDELLLEL